MKKAVLISIKPEYVAKILNGEKTIEVRKTAPKCELPVDVYIYCTKTIKPVSRYDWGEFTFDDLPKLGKVVAKFVLRKVEDVLRVYGPYPCDALRPDCRTKTLIPDEFYDMSCLSQSEVISYGNGGKVYAWHISDLEIFDKPRPITDFQGKMIFGAKPPQSWKYIYSDEITEGEKKNDKAN